MFSHPWARPALGTLLILASATGSAESQTTDERMRRGDEVIRHLNRGRPQPNLERLRQEFPFLAEATQAYALGDVWSRPGLDDRTRQIAAVSAMAALGLTDVMTIHAGYALNLGVTEEELKEVVYLVTVTAGFPRALAASQSLSDLFAERRKSREETP